MGGGIPSWAVKGAKVVCVDDSMRDLSPVPGYSPAGALDGLQEGGVYTVARAYSRDGYVVVVLVEIRRSEIAPDGRRFDRFFDGFNIKRFRPLVEDKSDAEIEAQIYHKKRLRSKADQRESEPA